MDQKKYTFNVNIFNYINNSPKKEEWLKCVHFETNGGKHIISDILQHNNCMTFFIAGRRFPVVYDMLNKVSIDDDSPCIVLDEFDEGEWVSNKEGNMLVKIEHVMIYTNNEPPIFVKPAYVYTLDSYDEAGNKIWIDNNGVLPENVEYCDLIYPAEEEAVADIEEIIEQAKCEEENKRKFEEIMQNSYCYKGGDIFILDSGDVIVYTADFSNKEMHEDLHDIELSVEAMYSPATNTLSTNKFNITIASEFIQQAYEYQIQEICRQIEAQGGTVLRDKNDSKKVEFELPETDVDFENDADEEFEDAGSIFSDVDINDLIDN